MGPATDEAQKGSWGKLKVLWFLSRNGGFWTRGQIAILILFLAACSPAAAKCSCGGSSGGASYNFLGDPAVDIGMDSFDEFVRENVRKTSVNLPAPSTAAQGRLSLDLGDLSHIDLVLSQADEELSGLGNITLDNRTEQVKATGSLQGNNLC